MNYDHSYHAGNFADVMKHLVMISILNRLQAKNKPLMILDTHAGCGRYDLQDERAIRTDEASEGIQLLWQQRTQIKHPLLLRYIYMLNDFNRDYDFLKYYPGSPLIFQYMMTKDTRLITCEKKLTVFEQLNYYLNDQQRVKVSNEDGYAGLKRLLPPSERRGFVIFIDPPYEVPNEFTLVTAALTEALRKFANGTYMIWYPIKYQDNIQQFFKNALSLLTKNIFVAELLKSQVQHFNQLKGSGLMIINLPYGIHEEIETGLHDCASLLSPNQLFQARTFWLKEPL